MRKIRLFILSFYGVFAQCPESIIVTNLRASFPECTLSEATGSRVGYYDNLGKEQTSLSCLKLPFTIRSPSKTELLLCFEIILSDDNDLCYYCPYHERDPRSRLFDANVRVKMNGEHLGLDFSVYFDPEKYRGYEGAKAVYNYSTLIASFRNLIPVVQKYISEHARPSRGTEDQSLSYSIYDIVSEDFESGDLKIYVHPHLVRDNLCGTKHGNLPQQISICAPEPFTQASIRPLGDRDTLLYSVNRFWELTFRKDGAPFELKFIIDANSAKDPRNIFLGNPKAADILPQTNLHQKKCWIEHVPETKMFVMSWNDLPPETTMEELLHCVINPYFQTVLSHINEKFGPQDAETMFKMPEMRIEHVPESASDEIKRWIKSHIIQTTQEEENFIFRHKLEGVMEKIMPYRHAPQEYHDSILGQFRDLKIGYQRSVAEDFLRLTQEHHTGPKPNCISIYPDHKNEFYFYMDGVSFVNDDVMQSILDQVGRESLLDALIMRNGSILNLEGSDSIPIKTVSHKTYQHPREFVSEKYVVAACFKDREASRGAIFLSVYDFMQALPELMQKMQDAVKDIKSEKVYDEIWAPLKDLPHTVTHPYKRSADFCGLPLELCVTVRLRKL